MKTASSSKNKRSRTSKIWIPIVVVVLIAASGFAYYYWKQQTSSAQQTTTSSEMYTAQARKGSINLTVTGSGTLAAGQETNLAFPASGTVGKVNVQVGDKVKKGDVLAELSNLSQLQDSINTAQQNLNSAQQNLDNLKQNAASNLANAQLTLVKAQKAVADSKSSILQQGEVRCDQKTIEAYYYKYTHAKDYLDSLGDGGGDNNYYVNTILPQKNIVAQAKAQYDYCAGYTSYEVNSSQASLLVAQADEQKAQTALDNLTKNNGIDPIELATADNKVSSAQLALDTAKENLASATITAPYDATVLTVAGSEGDTVNTGAFITIADLANPSVNFSIDEADMEKVAVGQTAKVVFDALPDFTFTGKITRIDPSLTTSGSYKVVTGVIQLDPIKDSAAAAKLLKGLTGTVTLVQASAENVLLVPIQALRDLGDGTYSVFVVGSDGKPKMKVVEVGIKDSSYAEIKSGLNVGDVVSTGATQVK